MFIEIEREEPGVLDKRYDHKGTFIIGCEPFAQDSRISELGEMALDWGEVIRARNDGNLESSPAG